MGPVKSDDLLLLCLGAVAKSLLNVRKSLSVGCAGGIANQSANQLRGTAWYWA